MQQEINCIKNELITNGIYKNFLQTRKKLYLNGLDYRTIEHYCNFDKIELRECFRIYNANHQRKKNGFNELCKWMFAIQNTQTYKDFEIVFGTLTFKDKVLDSTSARTRARYITKFLSNQTYHYMANIDFGNKNNREHYHFIAMIEKKMNLSKWKYGGNKVEVVPTTSQDIASVKNYLMKLNNHSYKESTRQQRILKDRNKESTVDLYCKYAIEEFHYFKVGMSCNRA